MLAFEGRRCSIPSASHAPTAKQRALAHASLTGVAVATPQLIAGHCRPALSHQTPPTLQVLRRCSRLPCVRRCPCGAARLGGVVAYVMLSLALPCCWRVRGACGSWSPGGAPPLPSGTSQPAPAGLSLGAGSSRAGHTPVLTRSGLGSSRVCCSVWSGLPVGLAVCSVPPAPDLRASSWHAARSPRRAGEG